MNSIDDRNLTSTCDMTSNQTIIDSQVEQIVQEIARKSDYIKYKSHCVPHYVILPVEMFSLLCCSKYAGEITLHQIDGGTNIIYTFRDMQICPSEVCGGISVF